VTHWTPAGITLVLQIFIAVIAVYIAWQQWRVNVRKSEFDRYERRLRVYQAVIAFLSCVHGNFKPEISDLDKFSSATAEADFLFKPEISAYLLEIVNRGLKLHASRMQKHHAVNQTDAPTSFPHYVAEQVESDILEQQMWFAKQREVAKAKFKMYLDVTV
jgi:hypothetical protein